MMSRVDEMFIEWNKKAKYEIGKSGVAWEKHERIPFSSPRLQYLTYGGIPADTGVLAEFSGPEGAGKTCAALDIVGNAQRKYPDRDAVFFDIEGTFDPVWATKLGVNCSQLKYVLPQEQYAELIFQYIIDLLEDAATNISVIVVDSIAALISKAAYDKDMDEQTMGGIARQLTLFCNKVTPLLRKKRCVLILINQVRDDMNSTYGGTVTPGGRGLKHACSLRLEFRRSDFFDESGNAVSTQAENPAGHFVKVKLLKTKICRPDRKVGTFSLRYLTGIDYISDLVDVGIKLGIFRQRGAYYYGSNVDGEEQSFQGKYKFISYIKENKDVEALYTDTINSLLTKEEEETDEALRQSIEGEHSDD